MKIHLADDDRARTSLYRGAERLAIEQALDDARLERRERMRQALLRRLPRQRRQDSSTAEDVRR
jgi:hypothetical protein